MPNTFQKVLLIAAFSFSISIQTAHAEGSIVINEFLVDPDSGQWVELYNSGTESVDISGWFIDDNGGSQKFTIQSSSIGPGEYKVFESTSFNFNRSSEDEVRLFNGSTVMDSFLYSTSPGVNYTYGRSTDGSNDWSIFNNPTKGASNNSSNPLPTPTATPQPTPTKAPTPTKVPTPTKTPTPGKSIYSAASSKTPTLSPATSKLAANTTSKTSPTKSASLSGIPTSILGISSKSAVKKQVDQENKTLVDSENKRNPAPFIIGAVLILACGILVLRNRLKSRQV